IQCYSIANTTNLAVDVVARLSIIDAIAVADAEAVLSAEPPDGVLHEPGERGREGRIEGSGVNLVGDAANNVGALSWLIAGGPVAMLGAAPGKDAGPMQEIVHQGIDRDHAAADLAPEIVTLWGGQQDARQRHGQHLVGYAVNLSQRLDQGGP